MSRVHRFVLFVVVAFVALFMLGNPMLTAQAAALHHVVSIHVHHVAPIAKYQVQVIDPAPAPEPAPEPVDGKTVLLGLSLTVGSFIESLKRVFLQPYAKSQNWSADRYKIVVVAAAILSSIGAAVLTGPKADALRMIGIDGLPSIIGVVLAGLVIVPGQEFVHLLIDSGRSASALFRAWVDKVSAEPIAPTLLSAASPTSTANWTSAIGSPDFDAFITRYGEAVLNNFLATQSQSQKQASGALASPPAPPSTPVQTPG